MKTYDLDLMNVSRVLFTHNILNVVVNNQVKILNGDADKAQNIIDNMYYGVENIIPTKFYYLLAITHLDDGINQILADLKIENIEEYAKYKAYLNGARYFEFGKAYELYLNVKDKLINLNPDLNFTLEQLQSMWLSASKI